MAAKPRDEDAVSVPQAQRTAAALILDNPLRDLSGLTLAAAEIALRDGAALLVPMYRQAVLFEWARPRALLVNYVRPSNSVLRRMAHERGVKVVVLETEGAPYVDLNMVAEGITSDADFARLAAFLFWSETTRDAVRQTSSPEQAPLFEVTGHPRFDLLVEPLRSQALPFRQATNPIILFATSFPIINNFANHTPASEIIAFWESMRCTDFAALDWLPQTSMRLVFVIKAVRAVAEAYPQARIVVRPHPFENHKLYSSAFADLDNVEVNATGSSIEAVAGASVFFHCRSNTGFEARALGVPTASIVPDGAPQKLPVDKTSTEIHTLDELFSFIEEAFRGDANQPEIPVEDYNYALGAHRGTAAVRVAEAVLKLADHQITPPALNRLPQRKWITGWQGFLRRGWNADEAERRKFFDAASVQQWLNHWSAAYGRPEMRARNVVGRPFLDPPMPFGGAPLAIEIRPATFDKVA
ncbi:MAG: surface carbohydrate biosynthesis protein [Pyrinomonadaceae bacterium]